MLTLSQTNGNVPVIGMSDGTKTAEAQACLRAGMSDTVSLPISKESLVRVIRKWCSE
jgi:CheY-like chemotaxis protein